MKHDFQIGIVGAGFAGLVAALRLKKSGRHSFVIFERAGEIGGTWRDNIYPGCACDVASPLYSFAQALNPDWENLYSSQPEILAYMKKVVKENGLEEHIRFHADIVEARFQPQTGGWLVADREGKQVSVSVLILGTGPLNRPHLPTFAGIENFNGKIFHSSQWDTSYDLQGKRVGVIGTGASAIQIIPNIAPLVSQLTVFQRTPAWVTPRKDRKFTEEEKQKFRRFPFALKWQRESIYWLNEFLGLGFIGNERINNIMRKFAVRRLTRQVKNPETRRKLTPNYKIGCKRILKSDDYYPVFNRENVALVTEPIETFTAEGIMAGGRLHPLDAVVFATGFIAADIDLYLIVIGLHGKNLVDEWKRTGAEAYLGTSITGYPNLCFLLGPNTGLGHNSVVHMMESQMNYIIQYIAFLESKAEGSYLDVKPDAQETYNERLQQQFKGTVWSSGCKSWYLNAAGKNTTLYPRLSVTFRKKTKRFNPSAYTLFRQRATT
jgi:cation diffusion facilitator CzcD-associated flavoprotein CzcO